MKLTGTYTHAGQNLAARLLTGGTLTLTRVAAGSGTTDPAAAQMDREEQALGLCAPSLEGRTALLRCTLNSTQASSPYTLTELGVYARDGENEVLYLLYTLDQPFLVDPAARVVLRFNLEQTLADGAQVTILAPLNGLVTQEELNTKADLVGGQVPYAQTPHLTSIVTLYVDASSGNDANPGTQASPFASVQGALNSLPEDLGGHDVTIYIAAGDYDSTIVRPFHGGIIGLYGVPGDASQVHIDGVTVGAASAVHISDCTITGIGAFTCLDFLLTQCVIQPRSDTGVTLYNGTQARFYKPQFVGCSTAIVVDRNSTLKAYECTGSGNTVGIRVGLNGDAPAFAILSSCSFGAATEIQKEGNSIVFKDGVQV